MVKTNGFLVVDSGIVIQYTKFAEVDIDQTIDDFSFVLHFMEEEDPSNADVKLYRTVQGNQIGIKIVNFKRKSYSGVGTAEPLEIATVKGKKVMLNFWISCLGDDGNLEIRYSIYKEA